MRHVARAACAASGSMALLAAALLVMTSCGGDEVTTQTTSAATLPYPIVDSGQTACYDAAREMAAAPAPGQDFYGQDAQFVRNKPSYTTSADGLTVTDDVTGLVWQRSPDTNGDGVINLSDKMTYEQALAYPAVLNAKKFAGYDDWRLPTIKEMYSLILFIGTDPNPMAPDATGHGAVPGHALLRVRLRHPGGGRAHHRLAVRVEHPLRVEDHGRQRHAVRGELRRWAHQGLRPHDAQRGGQEVRGAVRAGQPGIRHERLRR